MTNYEDGPLYVRWAAGRPDPTGNAPDLGPIALVRLYEGLWTDVNDGVSWIDSTQIAARNYGMRAGFAGLPIDDNVHYVKLGPFGYLVHGTELVFREELTDDEVADLEMRGVL